jgi:predicted nucleic acid-binding protein
MIIASIVRAHAMTLVTRNTNEFERVVGLPIENWTLGH